MSLLSERRPNVAARRALTAYRHEPLAARLHVRVRWWSAPFAAVEAELPVDGRILEIGCGHGLFVLYAGSEDGSGRSLLGVDIDAEKIAVARSAAAEVPDLSVRFRLGESGTVPSGPWDAVVILDVLYLLEEEQQRALLLAAAAELAADGVLLIKEMGTRPRWKAAWNSLQETLSVKVLRITAGEGRLVFVPPATIAEWLRAAGPRVEIRRLDRHRLHPHTLVVARRR